jgi:NIMA (never in mitosis gene a)-related kinase
VKLANLSEKEIENALNEVRILASLKNNSIVGYKEVFLEGKNLWYVHLHAAS